MGWLVANALVSAGILIALPLLVDAFTTYSIALYLLYAVAALGLGIAWGQAGLLSLGQGFFVGLGAYFSGISLINFSEDPALWPLLIVCVLAPGAIAYMIGTMIFRGRRQNGAFFALITLGLVLLASQVATSWRSVTGGFNGLLGIPGIPGMDNFDDAYTISAIALIVTLLTFAWLQSSPLAVLWRALAQDERRVAFLGFSVSRLKAVAFGISGTMGGLAGTLYAPANNLVTPDLFSFALSTNLVIWVAIGGRATLWGPILGAILIGMLTSGLRDSISFWELILAAIFICSVLHFHNGIMGRIEARFRRVCVGIGEYTRPAPPRRTAKNGNVSFENIHLRAGEVEILSGLSFEMRTPGIYCLIGPNGAGKTTAFNALTGEFPAQTGRLRFMGVDLRRPDAMLMARDGLGRKFQVPAVFDRLTIGENLSIALWCGRAGWCDMLRFSAMRWTSETMDHLILTFPFLAERDRMVRDLSHGQRQILDLAMVLAMEPKVILLDEPCAGLSTSETSQVADTIAWATKRFSATTLIIEHDMALVEKLASHVFVMHQGTLLAEGSVDAIKASDAVRAVYVGGRK